MVRSKTATPSAAWRLAPPRRGMPRLLLQATVLGAALVSLLAAAGCIFGTRQDTHEEGPTLSHLTSIQVSPDGRHVAVTTKRPGTGPLEGQGLAILDVWSRRTLFWCSDPQFTWSPQDWSDDGSQLLAVRIDSSRPPRFELGVVDVTEPRWARVPLERSWGVIAAAWIPGEAGIVFEGWRYVPPLRRLVTQQVAEDEGIHLLRLPSGEVEAIVPHARRYLQAVRRLAPDAEVTIFFLSFPSGARAERVLWVTPLRQPREKQLLRILQPIVFSPQGSRIAWLGSGQDQSCLLSVWDWDAQEVVRRVTIPDRIRELSWDAAGQTLACVGMQRLWTYAVAPGELRPIPLDLEEVGIAPRLGWLPDGLHLLAVRETSVWLIDVESGQSELVLQLDPQEPEHRG